MKAWAFLNYGGNTRPGCPQVIRYKLIIDVLHWLPVRQRIEYIRISGLAVPTWPYTNHLIEVCQPEVADHFALLRGGF